jgi:hypothetical protein
MNNQLNLEEVGSMVRKNIGIRILHVMDSDEKLYGDVTYDNGKPVKFEVNGVEFMVIGIARTYKNNFVCEVTLDEKNLSKLKEQDYELYEKIKIEAKENLFSTVMYSAVDYIEDKFSNSDLLTKREFNAIIEYVKEAIGNAWENLTDLEFEHEYSDDNLIKIMTEMRAIEVEIPMLEE